MSNLIEIKQSPDQSSQSIGLDKYNMSKFPGCFETIQPGKTSDGRWVTGLDEDALSIKRIKDPVLREQKRQEVLELREELERITGLDLSAHSKYWDNYYINIVGNLGLNFDLAHDRIKYYVLLANDQAAPEIDARSNPEYVNTKFYIHRSESEDGQKALKSQERDRVIAELYGMRDNRNKLLLIGKYILGTKIKDSMSLDSVYNTLRDSLTNDKEGTIVRRFTDAITKTVEELQYKLVVDEAIAKHVIRLREGYYQRGNATYGKSMKEVIKFLSSPENANEFASIKEELEEKRALG
jgi:hypothetical protein